MTKKKEEILNRTIGRPNEKPTTLIQEKVKTTDGKETENIEVKHYKKKNGKWIKTEIDQTKAINSANEGTFDYLLDTLGTEVQEYKDTIGRNKERHLRNMANEKNKGKLYNENGTLYNSIANAKIEKEKIENELKELRKPTIKPTMENYEKEEETKEDKTNE